jgi:hypothetical protein
LSINRISGMDHITYQYPDAYSPYGRPSSNNIIHVSISAEPERKQGCIWLINGEKCKKECVPLIFYCQDHKDIPDITRVIHDPLTTCIKRK